MIRRLVAFLLGAVRPAPRACAFHGSTHRCWRERRYGVAF